MICCRAVLFVDAQIVLTGDLVRVPHPLDNNVEREAGVDPVALAILAKRVAPLRIGLDAGTLADDAEVASEMLSRDAGKDGRLSLGKVLKGTTQNRHQLGGDEHGERLWDIMRTRRRFATRRSEPISVATDVEASRSSAELDRLPNQDILHTWGTSEMADTPLKLELRPMGVGDIFDTAFKLYQRRFLLFAVIALIVHVPYALITLVIGTPDNQDQVFATTIVTNVLFAFVIFPLGQAAMTVAVSKTVLGEPTSASSAFGDAAGRLMPLLLTMLLTGIAIVFGYILLIIPGIYLTLRYFFCTVIVVLEGHSGRGAMKRSAELVSGNYRKTINILLLLGLLSFILNFGLGFVLGTLQVSVALSEVILLVAQALFLPIQTTALLLFYYDLRVRKEAFDLDQLAQSMDVATAEPGSGSGQSD